MSEHVEVTVDGPPVTARVDTIRLLYTDGGFRDVAIDETVPVRFVEDVGAVVWRRSAAVLEQGRGWTWHVAADWGAQDGDSCSNWKRVRVETHAEEAARERAARLDAARQRDQERAARERAEKIAEAWRALAMARGRVETVFSSAVVDAANRLRALGIDPDTGAAVQEGARR